MLALRFEVWINSAVAGIGDIIWGFVICKFQDLMNMSFWFKEMVQAYIARCFFLYLSYSYLLIKSVFEFQLFI